MIRLAAVALSGLVLAACTTTQFDPERFPPEGGRSARGAIEERARQVASDYGLTVQMVSVDSKVERFRGDEDRTDQGYVAWMKVAECEQGNFVVKFNVAAVPILAYTRFGCSVEGVPSY